MSRRRARFIVFQSLFELDFQSFKIKKLEPVNIFEKNTEEMEDKDQVEFVKNLFFGVLEKKDIIDSMIEKAAPEWPISQINMVDRNVLRLGIYELIFSDPNAVPPKVAINEAIELAKTYGGVKSSKFVNGVLGSVYREMGEPGKDEVSKRKVHPKEVPFEEMPIERLGGAVVYSRHDGEIYLAFVHDVFGFWTLSKGRIEANENEQEGTVREIKEEIGADIKIEGELGRNEYIASHPEKGKVRKQVMYFLAQAEYKPLVLEKVGGGLDDTRWFKVTEIADLNIYNDILPLVTKAIKMVLTEVETNVEEKPKELLAE
jgi:N utilization substance protein B